ncbi:MAG: NAD(P)H-binding protein [Candidatus Obscuribacterales bacterium]|nr:NAD(P)H-binding protein [Candidatus Obscuribacterales bacterium]
MLLLIGGTGFLGDVVVENIMSEGKPLRLLTRGSGDWKHSNLSQYRKRGIEVVVGSLEDDATIERALEDVDCVINLSGSFRLSSDGSRASSYEYMNVVLVDKLLHYAKELGIQRFVQVSCLGARLESQSQFLSTKQEGDDLVMASDLYWTILRPSFLFGKIFPLAQLVKPLLKFKPFLPVIGSGLNQIEPVLVDDVAHAVTDCIYRKETVHQVYDMTGPESYSMTEIFCALRQELGLTDNTMTIPSQLSGKAFEMATKVLPKNTMSLELAQILIADSIATESAKEKVSNTFTLRGDSMDVHLDEIVESLKAK